MPAASETLVALERRLTERLLDFGRLDEAWPKGNAERCPLVDSFQAFRGGWCWCASRQEP